MKSRIRKLIAVTVIAGVALMLLAGCGSAAKQETESLAASTTAATEKATTAAPAEKLTVRYVSPGSAPNWVADRENVVNAQMEKDGVNLALKLVFIPWDVWDQKTNLMLSTDEEFELLHVMEDKTKASVYAGRGAIVPIDEYLDTAGANLKQLIPSYAWDTARINGKIYTVPAMGREWGNLDLMTVRTDLLEKYKLPLPKTMEEMITTAETIAKGEKDIKFAVMYKNNYIMHNFHREYDSWPFNVVDETFFVDQQGNVKAWIETEEFKKDCEFARKLYTKGLVPTDILNINLDNFNNLQNTGKFVFFAGAQLNIWPTLQKNVPGIQIDIFRLAPDKPVMRPLMFNNDNAVPKTAKHPEAGIGFLNWVYASQENFDLFMHGVEGKDWIDKGPGKYSLVDPTANPNTDFSSWKLAITNYLKYPVEAHPRMAESEALNDQAVNSATVGFNFDSKDVAVEYANVQAEVTASLYPLKLGVIDYEKGYAAAQAKMKAAGLDKVVAEYQKQLKEYLDSKK